MMEGEDLKRFFVAKKEEEKKNAPNFREMWQAAHLQYVRRKQLRYVAFAAIIALAFFVSIFIISLEYTSEAAPLAVDFKTPSDFLMPSDSVQKITTWQSPTTFLLQPLDHHLFKDHQ